MCLLFMAITQLNVVKSLPYIVSNTMSLLTCLPMAIGILIFGKSFSELFENNMLEVTGVIRDLSGSCFYIRIDETIYYKCFYICNSYIYTRLRFKFRDEKSEK